MSRVINSFTISGDGIEYLVSGFMPDEGFWIEVVVFDVTVDGCFQLFGRAVNAASELTFGEQCEPAFHQVQP